MKKLLIPLIMIAMVIGVQAQSNVPKSGFVIMSSEKNIKLIPGQKKNVDVEVIRSKSYSKTKIELLLGTRLPEGVAVNIVKPAEFNDPYVLEISTELDAIPGEYNLVINGKSARGTKGTMIKLEIGSNSISSN